MSLISLFLLAVAVVPVFALTAIGWLALSAEADELQALGNFEGMHFE